ncbi:chitin synthase chs-2-like [Littorina saxatilis]|uniref:chitin synthase n=1 Tax=Littorina saxatilis TaxID=31220 RepID=A0AAN9AVG8_9CAEN
MDSPLFADKSDLIYESSGLPNIYAGPVSAASGVNQTITAEVHSINGLVATNSTDPQVFAVREHSPDKPLTLSQDSGHQTGPQLPIERVETSRLTRTPSPPSDGKNHPNSETHRKQQPEPGVAQSHWPESRTGMQSYNYPESGDLLGGSGSRVKNKITPEAGAATAYGMPTIEEDGGGTDSGFHTPASNTSFNRTGSFSATYSSYGRTSTTSTGSGGRMAGHGKEALTVEGTWKVETVMKEKSYKRTSGVRLLATVKWLVTAAMLVVLTACLVAVKLSVLVLCVQLWDNGPSRQTEENLQTKWTRYSAQFLVLYIFLSVPPFAMFIRATWYGLLDKTVPWPRKKAVVLAVFSAALESAGLCLLCYSVLGRYQAPLSLLLLASLLLVPAINTIFIVKGMRNRGRLRARTFVFVVIGTLLLAAGLLGCFVLIYKTVSLDYELWHPAAAFVCLSIAWLPSLQHYISTSNSRKSKERTGASETEPFYGTFSDDSNDITDTTTTDTTSTLYTTTSADTTTTTTSNATSHRVSNPSRRAASGDLSSNAAWRTSFVVNGCRVLFTFVFSVALFMFDSGVSPGEFFTDTTHQAFLEAWDLPTHLRDPATWMAFWLGLGAGFLAYVLAFAACHMNMSVGALAPPLLLATPLSLTAVAVRPVCASLLPNSACSWESQHVQWVVPATVLLVLGHLLAFGWCLFRIDPVLLQQECLAFCVPGYNGVYLDGWLTINRRRDAFSKSADRKKKKKGKVFICTTMYREDEEEMRQLLESIRLINEAKTGGDRYFESHIIFDNGVRQKELSEFALTLISLLGETLGVEPSGCTKLVTPYGLKLSWALPGPAGQQMPFNIHLKDNLMVKNKKRWSQVMYMSYVLDFLTEDDDDAFILTTDADVVFTPDSVEALLDLMTRDNSIGAVCARTHPMGGGPLVWYQVFEYAIGHWFQKAAEHMLGSVLCAPGCFSVYRCKALADVLPKYAKRVETAFDFLTKDMGEDRWLCTLLVQSGWRIEYCAASENSTNCPSEFEEFYKQRRRWIASTLANLMLIVKEWKYVHILNHRVSVIFLLYQGLLLFSTLIGPSTVMLVVSGGLSYAWDVDAIAAVVVQMLACIGFAAWCIFTTQPKQLTVAKMYTFLYAVVMTAVVVGTAEQIVDDLSTSTESASSGGGGPNGTASTTTTLSPRQHISVDLPLSVTTLYFSILVCIFTAAGVLHPRECYCLVHGVWYLLCLPSGYLVLTIYSICNITDSSWGTREQASEKSAVKNAPWQERAQALFFDIFFCCPRKAPPSTTIDTGVQTYYPRTSSMLSEDVPQSPAPHDDFTSFSTPASIEMESQQDHVDEIPDETEPVLVEEWLPLEMRGRYAQLFRKHGFDSTLFIAGMTETDLRRIGVTSKGHLHYLLAQITLIPAFEIEYKVPTNVDEWLEEIGLLMYRDNFRRNHIRNPKEMEILKSFGRKEIERELGVIKDGHVKRLKYAISMLRDPTEAQQKNIKMRQVIDEAPMHDLRESNVEEHDFWETLKLKCLEPDLKAFGLEGEVKVKLASLRNDWLMILAVSNILWLILISTLASKGALTVLGANPLGLVFLVVFGLLFAIQFLAMLLHRLYTLSHYLARAPYRCGRPMSNSWAFSREKLRRSDFDETADWAAVLQVKQDEKRAWARVMHPKRKQKRLRTSNPSSAEHSTETTPLVV